MLRKLYDIGSTSPRLIPMEGARGVAVLLVFFVHYYALFGGSLPHGAVRSVFAFLGSIGNTGVDLFFVMSGYLIYSILVRRQPNYLDFVRRRIQRIYPTFTAVFAVYLVLSACYPGQNKIHGSPIWVGLYILQNFLLLPGMVRVEPIISVAWSLSYEFFYYLVLPVVVWAGRIRQWEPRWRLRGAVTAWVIQAVLFLMLQLPHPRLISFMTGIVLYEMLAAGIGQRLRDSGDLAAILLVFGSFGFFWAERNTGLIAPVVVVSTAFFLLALYSFGHGGVLASILSWAPLRWLGNMSYSYYLIHGLTLEGLRRGIEALQLGNSPTVLLSALPIGFGLTWCVSTVLFVLVEKRFSFSAAPHSARSATTGDHAHSLKLAPWEAADGVIGPSLLLTTKDSQHGLRRPRTEI